MIQVMCADVQKGRVFVSIPDSVKDLAGLQAEIVAEIQKRIDGAKNEEAKLAHVKDREIVKALFSRV